MTDIFTTEEIRILSPYLIDLPSKLPTEIIVLDLETSGFDHNKDVIFECGIAGLDLDTGTVRPLLDLPMREPHLAGRHKDSWIFRHSDLTPERIRTAPSSALAFKTIQYYIDNSYGVTAFNKKFDFGFLQHRGVELRRPWQCPMLQATDVCNIPGQFGKAKWPSVQEAWEFFFPFEFFIEAHRGCDDAVHEAKIVNELYKLGKIGPEVK
jgi:DNA polymerase-3 subunit epsilon